MLPIEAMLSRARPLRLRTRAGVRLASLIIVLLRRLPSRLLSSKSEPIDKEFFRKRLTAAILHRERVVKDSTACRLVFSEADLLPGLIVDRYGSYLVIQTLSQGMERSRDLIVLVLNELLAPAGILARNDAAVRKLESLPLEVVVLSGEVPERVAIKMNGLDLEADLMKGQKTGVYLDQRENYIAAANFARGRVLDCFTSTGGFALHTARHAESVEAVDSSAKTLWLRRRRQTRRRTASRISSSARLMCSTFCRASTASTA